jgi:hypothetical protein
MPDVEMLPLDLSADTGSTTGTGTTARVDDGNRSASLRLEQLWLAWNVGSRF